MGVGQDPRRLRQRLGIGRRRSRSIEAPAPDAAGLHQDLTRQHHVRGSLRVALYNLVSTPHEAAQLPAAGDLHGPFAVGAHGGRLIGLLLLPVDRRVAVSTDSGRDTVRRPSGEDHDRHAVALGLVDGAPEVQRAGVHVHHDRLRRSTEKGVANRRGQRHLFVDAQHGTRVRGAFRPRPGESLLHRSGIGARIDEDIAHALVSQGPHELPRGVGESHCLYTRVLDGLLTHSCAPFVRSGATTAPPRWAVRLPGSYAARTRFARGPF